MNLEWAGTFMKPTCPVQEAQESACLIPTAYMNRQKWVDGLGLSS